MIAEVLGVALVLLALLVAYTLVSHYTDDPRLPPGPIPLPLIGNMLQMGPKPHIGLTKLAQKYGKIFRLQVGVHRIVVINNIEVAREALVRKANDFAGRPQLYTANLISRGGKDIAFADFGPTWKEQRKIAHSALRMFGSGVKPIEERTCKEVDELIKRFAATEGKELDPQNDVILAVLNVICSFVFGKRYEMDDPEFETIMRYNEQFVKGFRSGSLIDFFPWLRHFPNKGLDLIKQAIKDRDVVLQKKYNEHLETYQDGVTRDLTDALLKVLKDTQEENPKIKCSFTEDHVLMTLFDVFSAGTETTSSCILWAIIFFVTNPQVQEKVHKELDAVIGAERMPQLDDRENLPFLEATIAEILRYSSLVPLLFPHSTTTDTTLSGYFIPKDTVIMCNVWSMHRDQKQWNSPFRFDPTRFLDSEGNYVCPATLSYMPFGAGRRVCLAESLGKIQLFLFISRMIHVFRFSVPEGGTVPDLEGIFGASLTPKPFKISITKRH